MKFFKTISLLFFFCLCSVFAAQTLGSNLDKRTLALGEVATLKIAVIDLQGKNVLSAPKNELLPFHFEVLKDSISKSDKQYERIIQFQVFEEGVFKIPALEFKIDGKLQTTIPYQIEVVNTAKEEDQIADIMKNKEISLGFKDYWDLYKWYVLGFLLLVALLFILYKIVRYAKSQKTSPKATSNKTLKQLEVLRKKKYIEKSEFRLFYVELIEITRNFLSEQYHIPANVLLTDDLVDFLKLNNTISIENEKLVEDVFLRGDLVKFAKTIPSEKTMEQDFQNIREFVKRSTKDVELENLTRKDV